LTDAFTREAVAFISKHKERPFFLYLPYTAVHGPLQVTQKYYDRFPHIEDEGSRIYAAMTSALDDGVGAVLDALEEDGLEQNTLVVFLSDNGAGVSEYCSNEPLRLGKQTMFEGGIRVPFTMKWPARISQGTTYEHPVSALDIFPTAVAAGGGELPTNREIDGVDLIPYLDGSNSEKPHGRLFWRAGPIWAARAGDWKLIYAADRYWLYDLSKDIGETNNLAKERGDIVKTIKAAYAKWNSRNIEPLWPTFGAKNMPQFSVDGVQVHWTF
ncbi:MAG: sulfatase-like hydrolase/transferase, partial [Gammaproteobacteria bacterium]|nr:sulfatase-like hydrolase/transferase [Gammaproteobacteria bacterium]